jgi:hypothetical protein
MRKPISTGAHAVLDYLTAGTFLALPSVLGFSKPLANAVRMVGAGKLVYAMATKHEGGIVKKIPMKTHLALDAIGGATLCALPFLLGEDESEETIATLCALGLFDIVAAPLTQTQMSEDSMIPDVGRQVRQVVQRGAQSLSGANA